MRSRLALLAALGSLVLAGCVTPPAEESLERGVEPSGDPLPWDAGWPDASSAAIRPGVPIHTAKRDCPSNFLFTKADNTSVFLGSTANCFRDMPVGTLVTVGGDENIGILIYSSWQTMSELDEQDGEAAEYNDFAVVRIDSSARAKASPAMLLRGGPSGEAEPASFAQGARLLTFVDDAPDARLSWRPGVVTSRVGDWALLMHAPLPALPGHMGGPVTTEDGSAVGIAISLGLVPNPGAVGVARLDALLAYASAHAKLDMVLATAPLSEE